MIRFKIGVVQIITLIATVSPVLAAKKPYERKFDEGAVSVTVRIADTQLQIAESAELVVQVDAPEGTAITFPAMESVLESLEIVATKNWDAIPIDGSADRRRWTRMTQVESLRAGSITVPPLQIAFVLPKGNSGEQKISTEPIPLLIASVLPESVKITDFRDIKSAVDDASSVFGFDRGMLFGIAGSLMTLGLAVLLWRYHRRRSIPSVQSWALREIGTIRRRGRDRIKSMNELQTDLIDVFRQYVTERFGIDADTMSNQEIAFSLSETAGISKSLVDSLAPIFDAANRARFAGTTSDDSDSAQIDHECDIMNDFVSNTSTSELPKPPEDA